MKVYNRHKGEFNEKHGLYRDKSGGEDLVEHLGYSSKEEQLQRLMSSGQDLARYNALMNAMHNPDLVEDPEELTIDRTSAKGYDFFDFHEDVQYLSAKKSEAELELQEYVKNELAKKKEAGTAESPVQQEAPAAASSTLG